MKDQKRIHRNRSSFMWMMKNMDRITWDKPVNKIKLDFEPFVKDHRNLAKWEILPIIYDVIIHYMTYYDGFDR